MATTKTPSKEYKPVHGGYPTSPPPAPIKTVWRNPLGLLGP